MRFLVLLAEPRLVLRPDHGLDGLDVLLLAGVVAPRDRDLVVLQARQRRVVVGPGPLAGRRPVAN
jgi:hypothetical protein